MINPRWNHQSCELLFLKLFSYRAWPQPVLLKQMPTENRLGFPIWDPRVSTDCFNRSEEMRGIYPITLRLLVMVGHGRLYFIQGNMVSFFIVME